MKGRSIEERDRGKALIPAVISARAAETVWPGEDPIGRHFTRGDPTDQFEVVGVVVDGHPTALEAESPLMVYVPYWHNNEGKSMLLVRTSGERDRRRRRPAPRDSLRRSGDCDRRRQPAAPGRRHGARGPPLPDVAVRGVRRCRAADCDRGRLRDDGVRRVAQAAGDEHPGRARRTRVAGVRARAAPERNAVTRRNRRRGCRRACGRDASWRACCSRSMRAIRW